MFPNGKTSSIVTITMIVSSFFWTIDSYRVAPGLPKPDKHFNLTSISSFEFGFSFLQLNNRKSRTKEEIGQADGALDDVEQYKMEMHES